ncbi:DUF1289 domain-containing protein [Pseudoalteromonas sp. NZS127_1]|jgi:hypothetical protein|uniref:DUF1289 domain-containing protein n=2 Tax=Pseudoalteromonas arctica TaxID=394751 RepID=A0AAP6Y0V4_9GAMM|nr:MULTISPECIES: DUF1289 domain-containing protein [Pseudoalteromonas]ATC87802.1 hypothetical protein PARC_a3426 [Pseudoalteromonas arctica A 37-1-2]MBG9991295.1 DUF1289 domain-containing protein [Pseudoalteromonas sp. NZS37]MBG9994978.1 DUF1289 domain-containing protein [Pseudoalteromonas sp. NZS127_1]MBG9998776.1 DUF1289 domain-containing protein [Pseudoalteromonas sp. NSLLW24]MBH0002623.1 DUF1289 domain-containing protein [Pseudoalteromonas sp. SWYJZ12]|tara:strand:+ start:998 stop:1243 length:246 start_codon:yes stop_codon:yes gene_type:complete
MQQIEIFDIPSPCKSICLVNNRGYCKGCYRSRDERFSWNTLTNDQKKKVLSLCQQRYKRYLQKKQQNAVPSTQAQQQGFDF